MTGAGGRSTLRTALVAIGVLLVGANLRASITAVGPVLDTIRADVGINAAAASLLVGLPLLAFAVFSPIAPPIAARFGIERTLGGSLVVLAAGIVIRSLPVTAAIWVGTVLLGFAIALINVILPSLVKREYPSRIGTMTGLYSAVQSGFAAIAAGLAVPIASVAPQGWRLALGVWAGLAIIALAVFLPQLRNPHVPVTGPVATVRRSPWTTAIGWQVTLFMGLQSAAYYTVILWWPSIEHDHGVAPAVAGFHQFVFQMMGLTGTVVCAGVLHRLRDQRPIAATAALLLLFAVVGQLALPDLALLWMILAGLGCGFAIVLALSLFGLRTTHHSQAAALSGMAQAIGYTLAAAGSMAVGVLHDATGGWSASLIMLAVLMVVVLITGVLASRDRVLPPAR